MKIAILSTYFGESMGGADISTSLFVDNLQKNGVDVEVASTSDTKGVFKIDFFRWLPISVVAFLLNTRLFRHSLERQIHKFITKTKPDIIHVQDITLLPATVEVAYKEKIPISCTVRDYRFICNLPICQSEGKICLGCSNKKYLHCLEEYSNQLYGFKGLAYLLYPFVRKTSVDFLVSLKRCKVIAVSDYVKNLLLACGIRDVDTIYNCVPDVNNSVKIKHDGFVIILPVATLARYKGVDYALKAFKQVLDNVKNNQAVQMIVSGEGPEKENLQSLAKELGLGESVRFIGKVPYNEMIYLYQSSDVVLIPSIWPEPLSRTIYDAASFGLPIVAFDVGGTKEMVKDGINGFVVSPKDYSQMAEVLISLIKDKRKYTQISHNSGRFLKNHNSAQINKMIKVYSLLNT